ncbi:hypothetical protein [Clostridium felsineum]|nr:hypothetical protein [Clostridium felsineum]
MYLLIDSTTEEPNSYEEIYINLNIMSANIKNGFLAINKIYIKVIK